MLNSALKLDYDVYSTSYFSTSDTPTIENQKIILKESDGESCGVFEDQFNPEVMLDVSKDYLDEVDHIIPISGISPTDFSKRHQKKILGTLTLERLRTSINFIMKSKMNF